MQPELVLVHTTIRYHDSLITVIGRPNTGLLIVADFDMPDSPAQSGSSPPTGAPAL